MESFFQFHKITKLPAIIEPLDNWNIEESKDIPIDMDTCPNCFNTDCLYSTDLLTCKECGHIVSRPFDNTAEYRYFSQDDRGGDPTRVGAPQDPRLPEASLGTIILNGYGTSKTNKVMYRVRKYHSWNTVPYKERSFIQTCERLNLIGNNNGINQSIIEESKNLYTTLHDIDGRIGLSRDALLSACLYTTLKQSGSPRKPKEISDIFGLTSAVFTKALKQIQEIMALARQKGRLNLTTANKPSQASTKATEYIQLPLSRLSIPHNQMEHVQMLCKRIAEKADDAGLSQENMPPSLAAGCIAFIIKRCDTLTISTIKIAEACNISIATLQKCLRRLESFSDILESVL
jgi:transcription initiation factor TFIIIB Brf1 subunit/transcription initiation factor TFIIB